MDRRWFFQARGEEMDLLQQQRFAMQQRRRQARQMAAQLIGNPRQRAAALRDVLQLIRDLAKMADREDRVGRVTVDGDILSYSAQDGRVGVFISAKPLTPENNYFEVELLDTGMSSAIGVGLVPFRYPLDRQPGWNPESVAYHADDGSLFKSNGFGRPFGSKCQVGDKMGCGIKFEEVKDENAIRHMVPVFFTRNGKEIGTVLVPMPPDGLYPAVGMHSEGEEVRINLEAERYDQSEVLMSIDNCDEEWARLHDIRVNGQLLEYVGRGSSIVDVGLAQSRKPLDTRHHYFEIEIADPGDKCYIAIGLARKNYPKRRHPGWNKGSIAYHADDGKIFVGSGVGDHFGPECHKGDIMGCGILFPRDYNSEADSDGSRDSGHGDDEDDDDYLEELEDLQNSDSEDEDWREKPFMEEGTKVQVFFTRNGKTIGRREVCIPKGGFYPTVGMLSSDEKVRVDLRPLTG